MAAAAESTQTGLTQPESTQLDPEDMDRGLTGNRTDANVIGSTTDTGQDGRLRGDGRSISTRDADKRAGAGWTVATGRKLPPEMRGDGRPKYGWTEAMDTTNPPPLTTAAGQLELGETGVLGCGGM